MRPEPALTPDAHADVLHAAERYEAQRANLGLDSWTNSNAPLP
jgi:hypothetical protein